MFSLLAAYGVDPNAHLPLRLRCCGAGGPAEELLPGFWHLLWRCWSPMRDCDALMQTTDLLLRAGVDANSGLAGLPVMREAFFFDGHQFEDRATALKAARYLRLLLLAGCRPDRLGRPSDIAGVLLAVWRSLRRPTAAEAATAAAAAAAASSGNPKQPTAASTLANPIDEEAESVCFSLTDCLMSCWPSLAARLLLPHHQQQYQLHHLLPRDLSYRHSCRRPPSLRVAAALAVRSGLGGRHFLRRLCCLPTASLDRNLRLLIRWPTAPAPKLTKSAALSNSDRSASANSVGLLICFSLTAFAVLASVDQPYCTFFGNRAPAPQPTLHNCTWYRQHSCCRGEEINITFASVRPLQGASRSCLRYFNSLMCYICSPSQWVFYRGESLTVCRDFCDKWYQACGSAFIKGQTVASLFENGYKLCDSRQFKVSTGKDDCFRYVAEEGEVFAEASGPPRPPAVALAAA
uniref:Folate_rec domain-containing protein n=1 Tax=Macrostomum lignano TaxID=282301 RepID=A0A1I8GUS8_9PLAT